MSWNGLIDESSISMIREFFSSMMLLIMCWPMPTMPMKIRYMNANGTIMRAIRWPSLCSCSRPCSSPSSTRRMGTF